MKREDIDNKYKWDLTKIFETDEKWEEEYKKTSSLVKNILKFKGKIMISSNALLKYLKESEKIERRLYKLYYYAHLKYDENTKDNLSQIRQSKIFNLFKEYTSISSFVYPEILSSDYSVVKKYIKENKELKEYSFSLENIFRYKKHTLSEKEEKILSKLSNALNASEDAYTSFICADIIFDKIKDEKGKKISLNESNYSTFITSKDRRVRKDAFTSLFKSYKEHKTLLASLYYSYLQRTVELSKIRNFNTSLESSLYSDNITSDIYDGLIKTVNDNITSIYKYYDLKKKVLKIDDFHLYDIYTPLISECDKKYTFEEAKDLILKALNPLGEDYLEIVKKAFNERWIDVYYSDGKKTGAYSSGNYDTNPYILMNFENDLKSVSTLIHELGHSVHTYLSCKNNSYVNSEYRIFVAEVASTTNEILLNKYIIDNSDDVNEKLYAINNLLELYKSTIFRQTMFAEFEKDVHQLVENSEPLTSDILSDKYYNLNKKYFGDNIIIDDEIRYEWERIPHFYYNYYVYKYATSLSISSKIANDIYSAKDGFKEKYIKFLSLGGSDYPLNELKTLGMNLSDSKYVYDAIKEFDKLINEFYISYDKRGEK